METVHNTYAIVISVGYYLLLFLIIVKYYTFDRNAE